MRVALARHGCLLDDLDENLGRAKEVVAEAAEVTLPSCGARRDFNGRVYSEFDIALLKAIGVGSRPSRLKQLGEVLGGR